ncbi:MAG: pitrilysin family protein [bacterium]|nr:pitrilysin family protein [bacterium]
MDYKKTILANGVRILTSEMPHMRSLATTVYVKAGSRYETEKINGISHFLEHMLFKGTKKYPGQADIARAIEGVGGQLNAWTDQDHTAYWNLLPFEFAKRGFEVLGEMVFSSLLEKEAIDRERGVIVEEINRRYDDPPSHVYELLIGLMWPDQPLGWPIVGSKNNIQNIKRKDFISYLNSFYQGNSIVISVAGNITHQKVVDGFGSIFGKATNGKILVSKKAYEVQKEPKKSVYFKQTDQAHLALGVRGFGNTDPDRYTWNLLNCILGQGMSSRLFLKIREEKGLAYHISSHIESYEDTGALIVHAGLNLGKLEEAIEGVIKEFKLLRDVIVRPDELQKAKDYLKGAISLSMDDTDSVSGWFGRQELLMPEVLTADQVIKKIESVTAEDVMRVAKRIFINKNLNLAIVAPLKDGNKLQSLLDMD